MGFDIESYKKVNERLAEFRNEFPEGTITTFRTEAKDGVSFKTVVCRNLDETIAFAQSGLSASTGHSFLPNYSRENDKVEEYAETVSIGRALAILGYGVEKSIASSEEMAQFQRNTEARQETKEPIKGSRFTTAHVEEATEPTPKEEEVVPQEELPKLKTSRAFKRGARFAAKS